MEEHTIRHGTATADVSDRELVEGMERAVSPARERDGIVGRAFTLPTVLLVDDNMVGREQDHC